MASGLVSKENCGICGQPLVYGGEARNLQCAYCGHNHRALIYCPKDHYICDECHSRTAIDIIKEVLALTRAADPAEIVELVMSHPAVPMHGPEHHALVAGAIVAAARNTGYAIPDTAVDKAIERGAIIPGGWCGYYGDCGAAVGLGVAVSVLTGATPLTGKQRSLALEATSVALARMLDEHPRCCKRATRRAIETAKLFLQEKMGIILPEGIKPRCTYTARNQQCPKEACAYYVK